MAVKNKPLSHKLLRKMNAYWRAANYLSVGQLFLVQDVINHLPQLGVNGAKLKQMMKYKLIEHKQYINKYGQDMQEMEQPKINTHYETK